MALILEQPVHSPLIVCCCCLFFFSLRKCDFIVISIPFHSFSRVIRRLMKIYAYRTFAPQASKIRISSNGCIIMMASAKALCRGFVTHSEGIASTRPKNRQQIHFNHGQKTFSSICNLINWARMLPELHNSNYLSCKRLPPLKMLMSPSLDLIIANRIT